MFRGVLRSSLLIFPKTDTCILKWKTTEWAFFDARIQVSDKDIFWKNVEKNCVFQVENSIVQSRNCESLDIKVNMTMPCLLGFCSLLISITYNESIYVYFCSYSKKSV